jgi:hypothetical protein
MCTDMPVNRSRAGSYTGSTLMTPIPFTRHACRAFAGIALAITALALTGTAVVVGTAEAYRLGLAISLVAAFNLALLHNVKQARAISRHRRHKTLDFIDT